MREIAYKTLACPACGSAQNTIFAPGVELATYELYRQFAGFDRLNYVICADCSLIFASPRIDYFANGLDDLFPEHVEQRSTEVLKSDRRQQALELNRQRFAKIESILGDRSSGELLEIGCGFGDAMMTAREFGFEPLGTEVMQGYLDYCAFRGLNVVRGDVDGLQFADDTFNVVFLEDVLEHLDDPFAYLRECVRVLKPGGVLFVHTWMLEKPGNVQDAFGDNWRNNFNLDLTAHMSIFSRTALNNGADRLGLRTEHFETTHRICPASPGSAKFVDIYWRRVDQ